MDLMERQTGHRRRKQARPLRLLKGVFRREGACLKVDLPGAGEDRVGLNSLHPRGPPSGLSIGAGSRAQGLAQSGEGDTRRGRVTPSRPSRMTQQRSRRASQCRPAPGSRPCHRAVIQIAFTGVTCSGGSREHTAGARRQLQRCFRGPLREGRRGRWVSGAPVPQSRSGSTQLAPQQRPRLPLLARVTRGLSGHDTWRLQSVP